MTEAEAPESQLSSAEKRWIGLYPVFINAKRTLADGRRVAKAKAIDQPTSQEMYDILKSAGLAVRIEKDKMHPRDLNRDMNFQGRVRVQLKLEDGTLADQKFTNRLSLMYYCAEMIPKLKSRQLKSGAASSNDASNTTAAGGKGKKKKK